MCPDTAPPHAPALAAPPQGACWLLCGWGATATPTSVERASALLLTAPHAPAPCLHVAVMAVELVLDAHPLVALAASSGAVWLLLFTCCMSMQSMYIYVLIYMMINGYLDDGDALPSPWWLVSTP